MHVGSDIWVRHETKASRALESARLLLENAHYDGASLLAAASCIQVAKASARRLRNDRDDQDWMTTFRCMMRDGRLPAELAKPFGMIRKAYENELSGPNDRDAKHAADMIALASTFHRAVMSAAAITDMRLSPEVIAAAKKRGVKMPPRPFGP